MLLEKMFESLQNEVSNESFTIACLRQEHLKLCEKVELANGVFSPLLFGIVSLDIPLMCTNFHQLIKSTSSETDPVLIISYLYWSFCRFVSSYVYVWNSSKRKGKSIEMHMFI